MSPVLPLALALLGALSPETGSSLAPPLDPSWLRLAIIDVEGGGAALFVTPEGRSLLVDAGWPDGLPGEGVSSSETIARTARDMGLQRIDYVLITHYHLDHVGGLGDLMARIPVGAVIDHGLNRELSAEHPPGGYSASALFESYEASVAGLPRHEVQAGDRFSLGRLELTFVSADGATRAGPDAPGPDVQSVCAVTPGKDEIGSEENRRSIGFVASFGDSRILHLSDLTWNEELTLVCPQNRLGAVDLMIVSHHGSALSNSPPLIAAVTPRVALMGNGARKGGDDAVFETFLTHAPDADLWQTHHSERAGPLNRSAEQIANPEAHDGPGQGLFAEIHASGKIIVTNARNGYRRVYPR